MASLDVLEEGLDGPEASGAEPALCAVTDGVILRVKSQLFLSLEGKAAMAAPILVHVTLRDGPH